MPNRNLLPIDRTLRTKALRVRRAKVWWVPFTIGKATWTDRLRGISVSVAVGSKRKNVKGVICANVAQVHYEAHTKEASYAVVTLKDRRVVFIAATNASETQPYASASAEVSHELDHLWWYSVTQAARDAFKAQCA